MTESRQRHVLRGPADDRLSSFIERYRPSISVPTHDHEQPYLSYVLAGGYEERFGGVAFACHEGTLTVHPRGDRHSNTMLPIATREIYFCIQPELETHLSKANLLSKRLDVRTPEAARLMLKAIPEIATPDALSPFALEAIVVEAITLAFRKTCRRGGAPRWLLQLEEYLRSCVDAEPSLSAIERSFGRDGSYVARLFRTHYGMTMGEYVRSLRIERASEALAATDTPIGEISTVLGFSDQSHFGRVFKKHTGMTPLAFRQSASDHRYRCVNLA